MPAHHWQRVLCSCWRSPLRHNPQCPALHSHTCMQRLVDRSALCTLSFTQHTLQGHGDILVPLDNCGGDYPREQCPNQELLEGIRSMKAQIDRWLSGA